MTKYLKLKLLDTIDEIKKTHENIINTNEKDKQNEWLIQCQEKAIMIGNKIETYYRTNTKTVFLLEEYCELLYLATIEILKINYFIEKLKEMINEVLNTLKEEIEEKVEVLFLPYKHSMWDSLESIYIATKKDEKCHCVIMPIPYYSINDQKEQKINYEGALFEKEQKIIHYLSYDISESKPDIIYLHNIYDNSNLVTSVHPNYYTENLRKYTKRLVYVPYYIFVNDIVEWEYVVLPSVRNCDYIVTQSEKVKEKTKFFLQMCEKENNCKGIFGDIEKKIVALGSPKIDCVRVLINNKQAIKEEFKQLIYKNGKKKKVVFYNIYLSSVIQLDIHLFLKKLIQTIHVFKDSEEMVLLLRPHPLLKESMNTKDSNLRETYENILDQFLINKWGIYDESIDLYQALSMSDIYYSDSYNSSILALFQIMDKPVIIQNHEV